VELQRDSESLEQLQALETGNGVSGPYLAFRALGLGQLDAALKLARGRPEVEARIIRLVGASDGATREMTENALKLGVKEAESEGTAWAMLALAARQRRDITPYLDPLSKSSDLTPEALRRLVETAPNDRAAFEKVLDHAHPVIRAHAYVLGLILAGKDAPQHWRDAAKRLLFASERPYFM
jgi:hypothetical protein